MNYYERYYRYFLESSDEMRQKSKAHWLEKHEENLKSGREDLIIFSASILAQICLAEKTLQKKRFLIDEHPN